MQTGRPGLRTVPKSAEPPGDGVSTRLEVLLGQLVGCPIEHSWDVDGTKGPQMLLTPEEEVAGELRHATGAQTALPVDIRNGRSVVRTDQNVLALKAPSETAQGKAYC